ncbi:MAG TPA: HD domain-containing protein, partial [Steroidobacteraceae bacterium]|nr:HD domain-containing protein [Steroidobacteraceae bacterium]
METSLLCPPELRAAIAGARARLEDSGAGAELAHAGEAAEIIGGLTESSELALALLARAALTHGTLLSEQAAAALGEAPTAIATALMRLGNLGLPRDWSPERGLDTRQTETLRKMLLAVVSDPRLVLARTAEELVALRHARNLPAAERARRALEARAIYAPLANRLGVWQLKWELEDLAFRYLEADEYRRVAAALNERRADRERFIEGLCEALRAQLQSAGIEAQVYGRPKHIYSIYRKMQRKQLDFAQLFDVRAVRVVVSSVPECYAALGIVHGRWPYIPGEFDDYI